MSAHATGAAFFDRDGTLIDLVHHLNDPAQVRLIPGAAETVSALNKAAIPVVIVTNQSVIGRGKLTEDGLSEIHKVLSEKLAAQDAHIDAFYHCPVAPTIKDARVIEHPDRKPGPGMLLRAAEDLGCDLSRSVMVGDTLSDMLAGRNAKVGATLLVRTGYGDRVELPDPAIDYVANDVAEARQIIDAILISGKTS